MLFPPHKVSGHGLHLSQRPSRPRSSRASDTLRGKGPFDDHPSTKPSSLPKPEGKNTLGDPGGRPNRGDQDLNNSLLLSLVPVSHPRKGSQEGEGIAQVTRGLGAVWSPCSLRPPAALLSVTHGGPPLVQLILEGCLEWVQRHRVKSVS